MPEYEDVVEVEEVGGGMLTLKWEDGLFEQTARGHQFSDEWDARYPAQGQTGADAPPGYVTLSADFFGEGNFRLPVTNLSEQFCHTIVFTCRNLAHWAW
ncbi:hypothetical protein Hanom_Chr16g01513681 [Helianthus anomalus]